jgi:predicted nucleic acid-binding protein
MVRAFIDTSVLVDVLRQRPFAIEWFEFQAGLAVTPFVQMELVAGAQNKIEQARALRLIANLQMIFPAQLDLEWAMQQQTMYVLSHNVGMNDCLIASASHRLQLPLYTTNLKHFAPLLGSLADKPY